MQIKYSCLWPTTQKYITSESKVNKTDVDEKQKTTHPEYKHEEQNPTMMLTIPMILVDQNDELLHPSN